MRHLLLIAAFLLTATPVAALVIDRDTVWQGEQSFAEDVRVLPGVTLTISPGAKLHFAGSRLEVAGTLVAEGAEFSGERWEGILLKGNVGTTRLANCLIRGAQTGVLVQGGAPELADLTLVDNKIGVELRGKAAGTLRGAFFAGNRKVALFVKDGSATAITDCRFEKNGRYGAYLYRARPGIFQGNVFTDNPVALMIAYHGSDPEVAGNRFERNEIAVQVDRAARPVLKDNLLRDNRTGLYAYRRSDPLVTGNRFYANDIGMLVAYSSYPQIEGNDFVDNQMALKLEYQSSAWEEQRGAQARGQETAARSAFAGQGMRNVTEEDRRPRLLNGTVDARGNWWGPSGVAELAQLSPSGNPSFIHDGRDQATFVDAGKKYPLDKVTYHPWSETPLTGRMP